MSLDVHPQLLRALRAVIDTGSFTAASERLGFTQSALSKQIGALETAVGTRLFERGARGAEPTPAALRLSRHAATVLDQLDAAERDLADLAQPLRGSVALGGFPTTAMRLVPQAIARVAAEHAAVDVAFVESSTPVQIRRLRGGRLDLALLAGNARDHHDLTGIETEPLPSGRLHLAVHAGHRLAGGGPVAVADLASERWIVGRGGRGQPQFGVWPGLDGGEVAAELAEWSTRLGFVAAGLGVATVPGLAVGALPRGVVAVPVDDPAMDRRPLLLARVGRLSASTAAVRRALIAAAADIAADTGDDGAASP